MNFILKITITCIIDFQRTPSYMLTYCVLPPGWPKSGLGQHYDSVLFSIFSKAPLNLIICIVLKEIAYIFVVFLYTPMLSVNNRSWHLMFSILYMFLYINWYNIFFNCFFIIPEIEMYGAFLFRNGVISAHSGVRDSGCKMWKINSTSTVMVFGGQG